MVNVQEDYNVIKYLHSYCLLAQKHTHSYSRFILSPHIPVLLLGTPDLSIKSLVTAHRSVNILPLFASQKGDNVLHCPKLC